MYLIFDTETTGLPSKFHKASDENQARVVQFAALMLDEKFNKIAAIKTLIKPDGWVAISDGAFKAHGISFEQCQKYGASMASVLDTFEAWANASRVIIAHNIKFDQQLMDIECEYHKRSAIVVRNVYRNLFCTMLHSTDICKIPHPSWSGRYKWPKVCEAYRHIVGSDPADQHDAFGDVTATAVIFQHLHKLGIVQSFLAL